MPSKAADQLFFFFVIVVFLIRASAGTIRLEHVGVFFLVSFFVGPLAGGLFVVVIRNQNGARRLLRQAFSILR